MKTLDSRNCGFQEMNIDEMKETSGGFAVLLIAIILIAAALLLSGDSNPAEQKK